MLASLSLMSSARMEQLHDYFSPWHSTKKECPYISLLAFYMVDVHYCEPTTDAFSKQVSRHELMAFASLSFG